MSVADHFIYAVLWIGFGFSHSLLAGADRDRGLGRVTGRGHRLAYNGIALVLLLAVVGAGYGLAGHGPPFTLPIYVVWALNALVLGGAVLGWYALRSYHRGTFIGTAQLRGGTDSTEPLALNGLHRWMRHPLYSAVLLVIWGLARSELAFATAFWITFYIVVGSRIEECRLIARYGEAYRSYRSVTPAFFPRLGPAVER